MPKTFYEIGDRIWSPIFEYGYVASPPIQTDITNIYGLRTLSEKYLAYFPTSVPFCAYVIAPKLDTPATQESIQLVQDNAVTTILTTSTKSNYKPGDIVSIKYYGTGIILAVYDNIPSMDAQHTMKYHVYLGNRNEFSIATDKNTTLLTPANAATRKQALSILYDQFIAPICDAMAPINPNRPDDKAHIQSMHKLIPFTLPDNRKTGDENDDTH